MARIQILAQDGSGVQDTDLQLVDTLTVQFVFADSTNNPQYCRFFWQLHSRKDSGDWSCI
jgi:hypothetical protein